jgi:hypothetical protein
MQRPSISVASEIYKNIRVEYQAKAIGESAEEGYDS